VVEPKPARRRPGRTRRHVKEQAGRLQGAKRELVVIDTIGRAPNGKVDYKAIKDRALAALGVAA
jgi:hypothetical protein